MFLGWDKYDRQARVYPTILVLIPLFTLQYFYLNKAIADWKNFWHSLLTVAVFSVPAVLFYLIMNAVQVLSKALFESLVFKGGVHFPTTDFLLHSNNEFSANYKKLLRDKIKSDFNIKLASKTDEENDELEARRRISEVVSFIRDKVKAGRFIHAHNIRYGFARNLVGGSILACALSIIDMFIFYFVDFQLFPLVFSSVLLLIYFLILISGRFTIRFLANIYARKLYEEYMQGSLA